MTCKTQITTNREECGPCSVFVSFAMAFALQLRKKHEKLSGRVAEECQCTYYQNTLITGTTHTHAHTLQNNLK